MSEFKFNVSIRVNDTQLTARSDDKDELEMNLAYLLETFGKEAPSVPISSNNHSSSDGRAEGALSCEICGGQAEIKNGIGKTGKPYRLLKCLKDYNHNKFL